MKTYVLTISRNYPTTHSRAGEPTSFILKINALTKLHTIRGNYELWKKRFDEIAKGKACLSVRYWTGKPYYSKQQEVFNLKNTDGIGIEKILFSDYLFTCLINDTIHSVSLETIADIDGLCLEDFKEWFKKYDLSKPMAIIHFTHFRYATT